MKSFLFSLGNSSDGPVGFCARVRAKTPEEALEKLKDRMPESVDAAYNDGEEDDIEYINVYFNDKAITLADIQHGETEDLITDEQRRVVEEALGRLPDDEEILDAMDNYSESTWTTAVLRKELKRQEAEFKAKGGRGVDLADSIDMLRMALAAREALTPNGA